jgi:hypothetical protein
MWQICLKESKAAQKNNCEAYLTVDELNDSRIRDYFNSELTPRVIPQRDVPAEIHLFFSV